MIRLYVCSFMILTVSLFIQYIDYLLTYLLSKLNIIHICLLYEFQRIRNMLIVIICFIWYCDIYLLTHSMNIIMWLLFRWIYLKLKYKERVQFIYARNMIILYICNFTILKLYLFIEYIDFLLTYLLSKLNSIHICLLYEF